MTVAEFERRVGSDEITEWMGFFAYKREQSRRAELDARALQGAASAGQKLKGR